MRPTGHRKVLFLKRKLLRRRFILSITLSKDIISLLGADLIVEQFSKVLSQITVKRVWAYRRYISTVFVLAAIPFIGRSRGG